MAGRFAPVDELCVGANAQHVPEPSASLELLHGKNDEEDESEHDRQDAKLTVNGCERLKKQHVCNDICAEESQVNHKSWD